MKPLSISRKFTERDSDYIRSYLHDITQYDALTPDDEVELAHQIHEGNLEARNKLVQSNLRFVVSVAKQYTNKGLELLDLINEGNIGLITAADRFDDTRGFKFISYAIHWIRQAILEAIAEKARMVRVPVNRLDDERHILEFICDYEKQVGSRPTIEEIAYATHLTEARVQCIMSQPGKHTSIDAPLSEESDSTLLDVRGDEDGPQTDDAIMHESLCTELANQMTCLLTEREKYVLMHFYGLLGRPMSLEEISQHIGLSRERTRQLRDNAKRTLRLSPYAHNLKAYLG